MEFNNANDAFEYYYDLIMLKGINFSGCKTLFNVGFYINNPSDNLITCSYRNWSHKYAEREWAWYLSGDTSVLDIGQYAKIWLSIADEHGNANSNYGYQWKRSEEHTSELQSRENLVCRLLLEKKKIQ